ncbi:MAG: mechanosensitive ion channel [bacterium]|nr:mechanosensitive ion channel [bacterium]
MIRALDLELLRGVGLSLGLFFFLLFFNKKFLYTITPKGSFLQNLQKNLRNPCLFLLFMLPAANLTYWIAVLEKYYPPLMAGIVLVLAIILIEFFFTFLYVIMGAVNQRPWFEHFFSLLRILVYSVLVYLAYSHFVLNQNDGGFFLAACWSILVFFLLDFGYNTVFTRIKFSHPLANMLATKMRWWGLAMVFLLTIEYAMTWLEKPPALLVSNVQMAVGFMICVGIIESFLIGLFKYYFEFIRKKPVSELFQDLTRIVVYVLFALVALGAVFREGLSSLLVSSTALSVILGLALQETLGNFFAGLSLSVAKPYGTGDYIDIDGQVGKVSKIDWRSTIIFTGFGESIVFPNSVLAKSTIKNYSQPAEKAGRIIELGVDYKHSPDLVRRVLLKAATSVEGVESTPAPCVYMMDFADSAIVYRIKYWIPEFASCLDIDSKVRESIWYHFSRNNINIPFPIRTVMGEINDNLSLKHKSDEKSASSGGDVKENHDIVAVKDFFGKDQLKELRDKFSFLDFSDDTLEKYANAFTLKLYGPGEKFVLSEEGNKIMLVIMRGSVSFKSSGKDGVKAAELGPGSAFGSKELWKEGELSLSACANEECAVLELNPAVMKDLFVENWQQLWEKYMSEICVAVPEEPKGDDGKESSEKESGGILSSFVLSKLNL